MATEFETIYNLFYKRVLEDPDFLMYKNTTEAEVLEIIKTKAFDYMIESIATIFEYSNPEPQIDFNDYDETLEQFNFDLTKSELQMIVNLMFEKFLSRDRAKLKIYNKYFSTNEVKMFSPANERNSFEAMLEYVEKKNIRAIRSYNSRDRETGVLKSYGGASY